MTDYIIVACALLLGFWAINTTDGKDRAGGSVTEAGIFAYTDFDGKEMLGTVATEIRCDARPFERVICGGLVAKWTPTGWEVVCPRCKNHRVTLPFVLGDLQKVDIAT